MMATHFLKPYMTRLAAITSMIPSLLSQIITVIPNQEKILYNTAKLY